MMNVMDVLEPVLLTGPFASEITRSRREKMKRWKARIGETKEEETMRRWNRETHAYEPMTVPEEWNCPIYALNMDEVVNCPSCGKEMTFGEGYVSLEIHNALGFGYSVCAECYHEEWARRREEGKGEG